ncbi:MAG: DUF1402 family protein [Rhizobiales bacterium]|nr:DUF1402 family protein [Hyphomicrobiales bacterium]
MRLIALSAAVCAAFLAATGVGNAASDPAAPPKAKAAAPAAGKQAIIVVPPDYHAKTQPQIYIGAKFLTTVQGSNYSEKYKKIYGLLARDKHLMANIKKAAAHFGIDPIHIIGAIVGEHTYNINTYDTLQTYYVKALQYADDQSLVFAYKGETAAKFFTRPQFAKCETIDALYAKWDCRQTVWNTKFYGKLVDGRLYPRDRLHRVFFQPMFSGQTFGIGQIRPVAALMVTDQVHAKAGLPLLTIDKASQVYQQIMNPDTSVEYVAANIRASIDAYKRIAGFDISQNAGITATLYNLGDAVTRASQLRAVNLARAQKGQPPQYPEENFYGWFINEHVADLRKLL